MLDIEIADNQSCLRVDHDLLRRLAISVLESEGVQQATISIALVDDPTIHELNRKYLNHDYATDVLSFVLDNSDGNLEGEVIASTETALKQAPTYDTPPAQELALYVLHGTLHLVGYEDGTPDQKQEMRAAEQRYLEPYLEALRGTNSEAVGGGE